MRAKVSNDTDSGPTTAPLKIPQRITAQVIPEFVRLPRAKERESYTGLSRSKLNELILPNEVNEWKPPVKSFVLRKRGARTGVRLISYASLRDFIRQHAETGLQEKEVS